MRFTALFLLIFLLPCAAATRRALLIGIDRYNPASGQASADPPKKSASRKGLTSGDVRHWMYHDLDGAVSDVNLMAGILAAPEFGFQSSDIVKLITPADTTAAAILAAMQRELVDTAASGDIRFVYYSGHGNFIRNEALKGSRNEFDQTIVPSDQWRGAVDVRDKEIARILWAAAKKGVTVTFIADSCHSGSLTRGPVNMRGRSRSNSGVRGPVDGVDFSEPVINDLPARDPATGKEIKPEELGVLTLAAAQENQEALELRGENNETHGALTMALVRAIREEGPHASMNRIFERVSNYLRVLNLSQTPVLGGKGRGDEDLLGGPAREEPFSVLVREVHGDEALLSGGEAIGLFPASELRHGNATLVVEKTLGLTEAAASVHPSGAAVASGDRFEVTKWGSPEEANLKVYVPPAASAQVIQHAVDAFAALRADPTIHWVDDPAAEHATDILRWSADRWLLDHIAKAVKTSDLGGSPSAQDVKKKLAGGARLFVLMPPTAAVSSGVAVGEGTRYPGIERLKGSDAQDADYRLYGRLAGSGVEYSWVQADADLAARPAAASSLPPSSKWVTDGAMLTEYAVRLGRVRAWLTLSGRPGRTEFPYHLVLRKAGASANARGKMYGGEQYKLYLQLNPKYEGRVTRRWVYVFVIDQNGEGQLLFPPAQSGNEGNHLPRATKDENPWAEPVPLIQLLDQPADLEIGPPWGTDTYILISTKDAIPNVDVFNFAGARSKGARGQSGSPLEDLLEECGDSSRGVIVARTPTEWSIERVSFESAAKK